MTGKIIRNIHSQLGLYNELEIISTFIKWINIHLNIKHHQNPTNFGILMSFARVHKRCALKYMSLLVMSLHDTFSGSFILQYQCHIPSSWNREITKTNIRIHFLAKDESFYQAIKIKRKIISFNIKRFFNIAFMWIHTVVSRKLETL